VAIRLDPQDSDAYYNRGLSYAGLGQYQRSVQDLDVAIRLDPTNATAYNNRGVAHRRLGQYDRAVADYGEAWRHNPIIPSPTSTGLRPTHFRARISRRGRTLSGRWSSSLTVSTWTG